MLLLQNNNSTLFCSNISVFGHILTLLRAWKLDDAVVHVEAATKTTYFSLITHRDTHFMGLNYSLNINLHTYANENAYFSRIGKFFRKNGSHL